MKIRLLLSHYKDVFYNKFYPLTVLNRNIAKKRNRKQSISILCSNCIGGYIYHQLGLPFKSPTINTMMLQPDFFKLISELKRYMLMDFAYLINDQVPSGFLEEVNVFFTHYKTAEEGATKWNSRKNRIDCDNIIIIMSDRDGLTSEQIKQIGEFGYKKVVLFTAKKYNYPYCFQLKDFKNQECVGNILKKDWLYGKWYFEKYFDYVTWINSEDNVVEHFRIK